MKQLDPEEKAVLTALVKACDDDPEGAFAAYHHAIEGAEDVPKFPFSLAVLRNLKRRKIIDGDGERGNHAAFYTNDESRKVLEANA